MRFLKVDLKKCKHDGICAAECPLMLIQMNADASFPVAVAEAGERCLKCGHCVAVCPHGALSVAGIEVQDCLPLKSDLFLSENQVGQLIKSRRSIRKYKDKKIEQEKLAKLIDIARYAPTGGNSQMGTMVGYQFTCWAGFFMIASTQSASVKKILNLPEGNVCVGGLMIGYPTYNYHRIPPRKDTLVFWRE